MEEGRGDNRSSAQFKATVLSKLIIDEKKFYLFGRNPDICDFTIDHQSCLFS